MAEPTLRTRDTDRVARKEDVANLIGRLTAALDETGYIAPGASDHDTESKRKLQYASLTSILNRAPLSATEVNALHGVLTALAGGKPAAAAAAGEEIAEGTS